MWGANLSRCLLSLLVVSSYIFLYIPIIVLVVFSFNNAAFPYHWVSFSTQWYTELLNSPVIWQATRNSLLVAFSSALLSLILGTVIVFYSSRKPLNKFLFLYSNVMIPEVVVAMSLLTMFIYFSVPLGLITLIVGHTILGLGYVVPIINAQFAELDYSLIEASLDLGATFGQTFFRIVLPLLSPALLAAGLLVFVISLDDFLISFFCAGSSAQTLSLYIFAMIRSGVSPTINALSTLLLLVSSIFIVLISFSNIRIKIF